VRYRLKEGVVLLRMCGEHFIFPSRKAKGLVPVILKASPELVSVLRPEGYTVKEVSMETEKKLKCLVKAGFAEEY